MAKNTQILEVVPEVNQSYVEAIYKAIKNRPNSENKVNLIINLHSCPLFGIREYKNLLSIFEYKHILKIWGISENNFNAIILTIYVYELGFQSKVIC